MLLFDFSLIDSIRKQHKPKNQHQLLQLLPIAKKGSQPMPQQNNNPRQSADTYSSHHTSSLQSFLRESMQSIKQFQGVNNNVRRDQGRYSKSVYEAPNVVRRPHSKNFQTCFKEDVIIQFYNSYLPLLELSPYLGMVQKIYLYYHREIYKHDHDSIVPLPMPYDIQVQLTQLVQAIRQVLFISQKKYEMFLKFKLASILFDWNLLVNVLTQISDTYNEQIQLKTQDRCQRRHYIKQIIKVIYTNINYMMDYIRLNEETFYYLRKQLTKHLMPRISYMRMDNKTLLTGYAHKSRQIIRSQYRRPTITHVNDSESSLFSDIMQTTSQNQQYAANNTQRKISKLFDVLNSKNITNSAYKQMYYCMQDSIKDLFDNIVSNNIGKEQKLQAYSTIARKTQSHKNHFLMGLYIGLGSITLLALLILLIFDLVELDYNQEKVDSMNYIFPMFRGIGLLILYLWGVAWNVYGFTKYRINHRLILEYGSHYSTHFQIMKRAGFFTLVFSAMLLLYCTIQSMTADPEKHKAGYLVEYSPFVVWVLYFSYIFFPNRDVFNPKGRRYFYDLLKKIIFSPIIKVTFLITWASDQAVSFVIPIKDFAYTICFYTSDVTIKSVQNCLSGNHIEGAVVTYVVAVLPLLLRMIQCYRQAKQQTGKFVGHLQMWNYLKYFSSVATATVSYLSTLYPQFFIFFVISSVISTSYSYYWDLKNDWGFLEKNSKHRFLRNHLSYKNPTLYYLAITTNLLFRCSWTLTISPSIVTLLHKSTFLPFLTGFIEIFRRCMWNFFRVEKQHLANCKDYVIMKPSVQKLVQKLKKKQKQAMIQSLQPHFQIQLGYSQKVKKQYIKSIRQQQNLADFFGVKEYQFQWANLTQEKVQAKKQQFLELLQRQKSIFKENKILTEKKFPILEETLY